MVRESGSLGIEAALRTAHENELTTISVVGEAELRSYGRDFLAVINAQAPVAVTLALVTDHPYN
ncbi:MAG: hypothetical protein ACHP7C_07250 [Lysobacterales bacterium]|jgi:superfamily II DNA helicase RecQ